MKTSTASRNAALALAAAAFLFAADAACASTMSNWGFVTALQTFRDVMAGPLAQTIAVIGIVGSVAALMFGGELNQLSKTMIYLVIAACILITANNMVNWLGSVSNADMSSGAEIALAHPTSFETLTASAAA